MSIKVYPKLILDALRNVRYPGTGKDVVEMGLVSDDIHIEGNKVSFSMSFEKRKKKIYYLKENKQIIPAQVW